VRVSHAYFKGHLNGRFWTSLRELSEEKRSVYETEKFWQAIQTGKKKDQMKLIRWLFLTSTASSCRYANFQLFERYSSSFKLFYFPIDFFTGLSALMSTLPLLTLLFKFAIAVIGCLQDKKSGGKHPPAAPS